MIPPGFSECRVEISSPAAGGPAFNVFGIANGANVDASAQAQLVAEVYQTPLTIPEMVMPQYVFESVEVTWNNVGTLEQGEAVIGVPGGTGGVNSPVAPQVSVLLHKETGLAGRQNSGRMYVPGCAEVSVLPSGRLDSTSQVNFQAWSNTFLEQLQVRLIGMVILHNAIGPLPTAVTSLIVRPLVATQRRRLR